MSLCRSVELALLCCVALAHAHYKRAEMSPVPFTFAARYGRSPDRFITPRNDRWMLTTRYGKRSERPLEVPPSPPAPPSPPDVGGERGALACRYTGLMEFYRCTRRANTNSFERSADEDPAPNDEQ